MGTERILTTYRTAPNERVRNEYRTGSNGYRTNIERIENDSKRVSNGSERINGITVPVQADESIDSDRNIRSSKSDKRKNTNLEKRCFVEDLHAQVRRNFPRRRDIIRGYNVDGPVTS